MIKKLIKIILTIIPLVISQDSCLDCINRINNNQNFDCSRIWLNQDVNLNNCKDYTRCLYNYNLHNIENNCFCQKVICEYDYVCPYVEKINLNNILPGYSIFEVSLELKDLNSNIYAIYGTEENIMRVPAAYQKTNYQGVNVGGIIFTII